MPNWCYNSAEISGPASVIRKIEQGAREGKLFESLRPIPVGQEENWYEWNISNWGTKWDTTADVNNIEEPDENGVASITLMFDSAWSPPVEWYAYITEKYLVNVDALYHEPGVGYVGQWADGVDECYEYLDYAANEIREFIGEKLDDYWGISENMLWDESDFEVDLDKLEEEEKPTQ